MAKKTSKKKSAQSGLTGTIVLMRLTKKQCEDLLDTKGGGPTPPTGPKGGLTGTIVCELTSEECHAILCKR